MEDQTAARWALVLQRYLRVVPINRSAERWNIQEEYPGDFWQAKVHLTDRKLLEMLRHEHWLASRAPEDGVIDRLCFDIDNDRDPASCGPLEERYGRVREIIGSSRVPLVYRTPGGGLRVLYRIPRSPIPHFIEDRTIGLLADVLRAAGQTVEPGVLEIFPQKKQCDRLPLGKDMPLLDPSTLNPLLHPSCDRLEDLEEELRVLEEWFESPDPTLFDHLQSLPRQGGESFSVRTTGFLNRSGAAVSATETEELIANGLSGPSSRHEAIWIVGLGFMSRPDLSEDYRLTATSSDEDYANAIALWLANHHNGFSKDWARMYGRYGRGGAIQEVASRLLRRSANGCSTIQRLRSSSWQSDDVRQLSSFEWDRILETAEQWYGAGAQRYRFEIWAGCFTRACKELMFNIKVDGRRNPRLRTRKGREQVLIEIPAEWMVNWPYGSGRDGDSKTTRYCDYLAILEIEGFIEFGKGHYNSGEVPNKFRKEASVATAWWIDIPPPLTSGELAAPLSDVIRIAEGLPQAYGRRITAVEVFHSLHLSGCNRRLVERYGRRTAERISSYRQAVADLAMFAPYHAAQCSNNPKAA